MRTLLFAIILSAAGCMPAAAGEMIIPQSAGRIIYTNVTFSSNVTASVTFTNVQNTIITVNHTFQLFCTGAGTNVVTANLDRTIDEANWIPVSTNTVSTNGTVEYSVAGKWSKYRWRISAAATNATVTANYMAQ